MTDLTHYKTPLKPTPFHRRTAALRSLGSPSWLVSRISLAVASDSGSMLIIAAKATMSPDRTSAVKLSRAGMACGPIAPNVSAAAVRNWVSG